MLATTFSGNPQDPTVMGALFHSLTSCLKSTPTHKLWPSECWVRSQTLTVQTSFWNYSTHKNLRAVFRRFSPLVDNDYFNTSVSNFLIN